MKITAPIYKEDTHLHLFNKDIAAQNYGGLKNRQYDIEGAILLTDLARNIEGIKKYRKDGKVAAREMDGWYYTSVKDLAKRHPYIKKRTVRRILARLRKEKVLKTTKTFHKRKSIHTLYYSFADKELHKEALATEDGISFWVEDAVECGIEAAILLRNLTYVEEHWIHGDAWIQLNPVEFLDATDLPMSPQAVRRALVTLVKKGRLERRRNNKYGDNYYLYRLVDTPHLRRRVGTDALPTECYDQPFFEDNLPSEHYEKLPALTAHRHHKDKENRMLKEYADHVAKVKSQPKSTPRQRKTVT
ncbi:hypothetical protein NXS98_06095 [Fontisphaera persica]|uniref:hypothetical protein n=1 Tax=Fontisphaera persica TaxID=2974023 RepID=UPI0024BFF0A6|nr:hypothetical protein [Fontisphaera persica]WCJ60695.1 hypothetical protein NXS98_06095 [Fontisphaera persica]